MIRKLLEKLGLIVSDDNPVGMTAWEAALTTYDEVQAAIAASRLGDEDIPVQVRKEAAGSVLPVGVGILGRIDVMVPEVFLSQARAVLDDTLGASPEGNDNSFSEGNGDCSPEG
nr:DUF2007 domain-containing protein [Anaerolineae bacterium]